MSRQFATYARFLLLVLGVTAVLTLTVHATPTSQESSRPRFNLEDIPYQPADNSTTPNESALAVMAPNILLPWSKVAFQSLRNGNWDIFVGNDDGTGQTAVVSSGSSEIQPHLNRGNTKIVYASNSGGDYEIVTANINGSGQTALTNNNTNDGNPSWSPDGSKIVFEAYRNGEADIYVMNADGTNQVRLTSHADFDGMPTWSPDGSKIAFVSRRTGGYRIYVMNADGTGQTQLSNQPYSLRPQWSPDGSQIAYDADHDGDGWQDLWRMNADGTSQTLVVNPSGQTDAWASSWSPDGSRIVYTLISFVYYQSNWYWTHAYPDAWGSGLGTTRLSSSGLDWDAAWQTSDVIPPTFQVNALPAQSPGPIPVSWSGSDKGGSGAHRYFVQVKVGNGSWTDWLTNTGATSGNYPGIGGQTYAFRVRASDKAFNYEAWSANQDPATTVESLPPTTSITVLPAYSHYNHSLTVSWGGTDPGLSGIKNYDVQYKIGTNGTWANWRMGTTQTTAVLSGGTPEATYYFRVRGTDKAENTESWPAGNGDSQTTFYRWASYGHAFDNTHTPVSGATSTTTPAAASIVPSDTDGSYISYVLGNSTLYTASWNKPGYGSLPTTSFLPEPNGYRSVVLPPTDNIIANWGFETGAITPEWGTSGTLPQFITSTTQNSGEFSVGLGTPNATFTSNLSSMVGDYQRPKVIFGPNGEINLFWRDANGEGPNTLFSELLPSGTWSSPAIISSSETQFAGIGKSAIGQDGSIHVVLYVQQSEGSFQKADIYYTRRSPAKIWSTPIKIYSSNNPYGNIVHDPQLVVTDSGIVHLVWKEVIMLDSSTACDAVYYLRRSLNGTWQSFKDVSEGCGVSVADTVYLLNHDETLHILWNNNHRMRNSDGNWSAKEVLFAESLDIRSVIVDANGFIHMLIGAIFTDPIYYLSNETYWSEPLKIGDGTYAFIDEDNEGNIHLTWLSPNYTGLVYHRERTSDRTWQPPKVIFKDITELQGMKIDANDKMHIAFLKGINNQQELFYSWADQNGVWDLPIQISTSGLSALLLELQVDSFGNYHLYWQEFLYSSGISNIYFYAGPTKAAQNGSRNIEQVVTLTPSLANPILSFLYQAGGLGPNGASEFVVQVSGLGGEDTLFSTRQSTAGWTHQWIDLSAWIGETITLTFELNQAANKPTAWVYLDEVSLGSTFNDVWVEIESVNGALGETVPIAISFGNRGGALAEDVEVSLSLPSSLVFKGSNIPSINPTTPTWQTGSLPAKSEVQTIVVYVQVKSSAASFTNFTTTASVATSSNELETLNNTATGTLFTGKYLYLPMVRK